MQSEEVKEEDGGLPPEDEPDIFELEGAVCYLCVWCGGVEVGWVGRLPPQDELDLFKPEGALHPVGVKVAVVEGR